jgi:predicted enzyme related to lactoylglutathione lyase
VLLAASRSSKTAARASRSVRAVHDERRQEMAGELAFFELGVADLERGRAFYGSLLGWRFDTGPSGGGTIEGAGVRGGMHGDHPRGEPLVFFAVDDMERALERVRELGGEVDDMDVEGDEASQARHGRFKLCRDDQGSPFGLHQPPRS